ncbi:MAG: TolC family protein [Bryobacteraceae bacterium]
MTRPLAALLACIPLAAQPLSLRDAVKLALAGHPSLEAAAAETKAAEARIGQAQAGLRPRVSYTENFTTSNNPVFAFGSLLNQRRFSESNFRIDALNSPGFVNNFQSQIAAEHTVWDFGATKASIHGAELGKKRTQENENTLRLHRIAAVARTYHLVTLAKESLSAAGSAVKSAQADLDRAEAVRAAGMSTDADVLTIKVHLAAMREQQVRRKYDLEVAQAELNESLGAPLDTPRDLSTPLEPTRAPAAALDTLESSARTQRPEFRLVELERNMADNQRAAARSALYPQIVARGMFEADRGRFVTQAGANWFFGGGLRWNFDAGGGVRKRMEEASQAAAVAKAHEREAASGIALEVRQARAAVLSANERLEVVNAAVTQAEESLRIVKNRFEAGLTTVDQLLRNETALLEAKTRRLAAIYDQRVAAVMLEHATGTLTGDSDVLQ